VTNLTADDRFYLGVGYENMQLPPNMPCSDDYDSLCSIQNVRSLLGKAQFHLYQAVSLEHFEAALFDLSFSEDEYQIPGGFYTLYDYKGQLKSHAVQHNEDFGKLLSNIFVEKSLGKKEEGQALLVTFRQAAEDNSGWVQYRWRNSLEEATYTKNCVFSQGGV
jgi:signal transduction histidine kinase